MSNITQDEWLAYIKNREELDKLIDWKWVVVIHWTSPWTLEGFFVSIDKFDPLQTYHSTDKAYYYETENNGNRLVKDSKNKHWFVFDTKEEAEEFSNYHRFEEKSKEIYRRRKELEKLITDCQTVDLNKYYRYKKLQYLNKL
jgi:hypothetical protein